jgi:TonB family protein
MNMHRTLVVAAALLLLPEAAALAQECRWDSIPATHTKPPYPPLAQERGENGTTEMMVLLDSAGVPASVEITKSSGSLRLDDAAVAHVKSTWRWMPGAPNCQAQAPVRIVWNILEREDQFEPTIIITPAPEDYPAEARRQGQEGLVALFIVVDDTGAVRDVRVSRSSGFPVLDDKAQEIARRSKWEAAKKDGKPVPTLLLTVIRWQLKPPAP